MVGNEHRLVGICPFVVPEVDALVRRAIEARARLEATDQAVSRLREQCDDHWQRLRRLGQDSLARRRRQSLKHRTI